ncbi:hypothetical protein [Rhizobium sp. 2MFCol3.1]|uniref:hypothetical protein n=1 Tax=Rhizobium sp. 2MFCol3.1 TaxID=1246459 RepID=UPI00037B9B93|nr:hypothetical protein [Rhizobium sp. 2MFCol3.1]
MADEISGNSTNVEPAVSQETTKKTRARRRSKAEMAAALAARSSKRASKTKSTSLGSSVSAIKEPTQKVATKAAPLKVRQGANNVDSATPFGASDLADLIALEAENKKLRKSLAEKLRSENADLRKKLGLD